jgi:DNA polymerase-3 subunit epsilon
LIVAYDTETTGLWKNALPVDHHAQPKICSLSAMLIDETSPSTFEVVATMDVIVKPDGWTIPDPVLPPLGLTLAEAKIQGVKISASDVHGITQAMADERGVPLFAALKQFNELVLQADTLLAHNEAYDNNVIRHALKLLKRTIPLPEKRVCTMMMAKDYCRLPPNFPGGDWKWPKLEEAYRVLFDKELENAHNSLADITQSVEVYQELKRRGVPDAGPAIERRGMKLKDWVELGWTRERLEKLIALRFQTNTKLTDWDRKFLLSLHERLLEFGDNVYLSEKQIDIFRKIEERGTAAP